MVVCRLVRVGPDLTVSHDIPAKAGKCRHCYTESYCWYGDFEIVVLSGGAAGEQLQRPTGRDLPRAIESP